MSTCLIAVNVLFRHLQSQPLMRSALKCRLRTANKALNKYIIHFGWLYMLCVLDNLVSVLVNNEGYSVQDSTIYERTDLPKAAKGCNAYLLID